MWLIAYDGRKVGIGARHRIRAHALVLGVCVAVRNGTEGWMWTFVVPEIEPGC